MLNRRLEYLLLALILFYAAFIRVCLINAPFHSTAEGVGSWYGIMARNYLRIDWSEHKGVAVQSIGHWPGTPLRFYSHHPPLMPLSIALSYKVFGEGDWQTRLPAALCSVGSVLLLYLLLKQYNAAAGLYAAAIFASLPLVLYYGGQPEFLNPQFVFFLLLSTAAFFHFNARPGVRSLLLLCGAFAFTAATDWPAFYLVPLTTIYFLVTHKLKYWPLNASFILFSIVMFASLYAQIVVAATHDWWWMQEQIRTRTIGNTPAQKISFLTWLGQAWVYNREHHTIGVLVLSTGWVVAMIVNRRWKIENRIPRFLLFFALLHLLIAREGSYSHSWWWWPLTPFLALSAGLCITQLIRILPPRATIPSHILTIVLVIFFAVMNLKNTLPHLLDADLTSAGQPYDGPTLAAAVHFASPDSNTPVILVSGDCHPSLWYYADRPIKMNVWSVNQFEESLANDSADLPFYFQQKCPARPVAVIVPKLYFNAAGDLLDHLRAHYAPLPAPPNLAEQYEFFKLKPSTDSASR